MADHRATIRSEVWSEATPGLAILPPMTQDGRRRPRRWARLGKLQPLLQRKGQPSSQRAQLLA